MVFPAIVAGIAAGVQHANNQKNTEKQFDKEMTAEQAASALFKHKEKADTANGWGAALFGADKQIGKEDLQAIVNDPQKYPADLVKAAAYFLKNPGEFQKIAGDHLISFDELANKVQRDAQTKAAQQKATCGTPSHKGAERTSGTKEMRDNLRKETQLQRAFEHGAKILAKFFDILDTAAGGGVKDGGIGRADLEAALKDPYLPKELRQVIEMALKSPTFMNYLDMADGSRKDGLITRDGINKLASQASPEQGNLSTTPLPANKSENIQQTSMPHHKTTQCSGDAHRTQANASAAPAQSVAPKKDYTSNYSVSNVSKTGVISEKQYQALHSSSMKVEDAKKAYENAKPEEKEAKMMEYKQALQERDQLFQFLMSILQNQDKIFQTFARALGG